MYSPSPPSVNSLIVTAILCLVMATNHSNNEFVDLSGIGNISSGNPYDGLIELCHDDPVRLPVALTTMTILRIL